MEPATVDYRATEKYDDKDRSFNMILGADVTPGGRIWCAWIGGGDNDDGYLLAASSEDGGRNWSKPTLAVNPHHYDEEKRGLPKLRTLVGNFWTDPLGRLWLFYDQSLGYFDGRGGVWAIVAENPDAKQPHWTTPTRIFDGALLNKPIITSKGEWLAFTSLWSRIIIGPPLFLEGHHNLDSRRGINVHRSLDQGRSWESLGLITIPDPIWSFDEPSVVELKNGDLWMLIRTQQGLLESYSKDGGRTWATPVRSAIISTSARIFLRRLASGNLLLVKYGRKIDATQGRGELTAYLSQEDGRFWVGGLVIDERFVVSYPDGFQDKDGNIHIFYDYNRAAQGEILTSVFSEKEVLAGRFDANNDRKRVLVNKALKPLPPPAAPAPAEKKKP